MGVESGTHGQTLGSYHLKVPFGDMFSPCSLVQNGTDSLRTVHYGLRRQLEEEKVPFSDIYNTSAEDLRG